MKRRSAILVLVLVLAAVVRCDERSHRDGRVSPAMEAPPRAQAKSADGDLMFGMPEAAGEQYHEEIVAPGRAGPAPQPSAVEQDYWAQQKLIRTARLDLEVGRVEEAIGRIEELVDARGGMLADSNRSRGEERWESAHLTLRVPSGELDRLLAELREVGEVRHEGISTEDVTKAYFDLETRLSVKRQTEARLRELLARSDAELKDLVAIERELDRVVTEIEQMLGEKRYYDERIAVSTVHVSLEERGAFVRPGAFSPIVDALRESAHVLGRSVAGLISFAILALPWVVVALVAWRGVRWVRARRRKKRAAT